jgi:hypothetical protein
MKLIKNFVIYLGDNSGKMVAAVVIMTIVLAVMIIVIFLCISLKKTESRPFPLEDEQRSVCV